MSKVGSVLVCVGLLAYFSTARAATIEDAIKKHNIHGCEGYEQLLRSTGGPSLSRKLQQGFDVNLGLVVASRDGDTSAVQQLLNLGADPNYVTPDGKFSPLIAAAITNEGSVVPLLVQAGASLTREVAGLTPLEVSVVFSSTSTARALIAAGADPNSVMHMAAIRNEASVLEVLIQGGGDVNLVSDGITVLSIAAYVGSEEAINVLVSNGADKTKTGDHGVTPREALCQCIFSDEEVKGCQFEKCGTPQRMISLLT